MNWTRIAPREEKTAVTGRHRPLRRLKVRNAAELVVSVLVIEEKNENEVNSFQHVHLFLCYHFSSCEKERFHPHDRNPVTERCCPKILFFPPKQKNCIYSAHVYQNRQRKGRRERKIFASPGAAIVGILGGILCFFVNLILLIHTFTCWLRGECINPLPSCAPGGSLHTVPQRYEPKTYKAS